MNRRSDGNRSRLDAGPIRFVGIILRASVMVLPPDRQACRRQKSHAPSAGLRVCLDAVLAPVLPARGAVSGRVQQVGTARVREAEGIRDERLQKLAAWSLGVRLIQKDLGWLEPEKFETCPGWGAKFFSTAYDSPFDA